MRTTVTEPVSRARAARAPRAPGVSCPTFRSVPRRPSWRGPSAGLAIAGLLVALFAAPSSHGQQVGPTSAQESEADALFRRGNELVAKKDFAGACPLFEQAYHIAGGGGTAQNLAICYEDLGKPALAYRAFAELRRVSLSPPRPERVKLAEERMARLEPRVSRLVVHVAEGRRSPDLLVAIDGDTYGDKALAEGVVVDVGVHVVKVVSPGRAPLELTKTVAREGTTETVEVPADDPAPAPVVGAQPKDDHEASRAAVRTAGLVLGGAGVATVLVGGVFAILTATTNASARNACRDRTPGQSLSNKGTTDDPTKYFDAAGGCYASTPSQPNPYLEESNRIRDEARGYGTLATIMVPLGIASAAAGAYMIWSSRTPEHAEPKKTARAPQRPTLVPGFGGVMLVGELP